MFEIKIGVLGYVSVGKTTIINALFGAEYGEVAMKRTTAVVNSFRIGSSPQGIMPVVVKSDEDSESEDSLESVTNKLSARATLKETTADNASFRNSGIVKEKAFDISLEEPFHKMRPDTQLVVVDIPGINEAGSSSKYKDFVNQNWHTFDVIVLVMDARQGVNTEEQHDLLKLVKENLSSSKDVPVIILANKVDDPDNKEQKALLDEARADIAKLFGVSDREKALQTLLNPPKTKTAKRRQQSSLFPAVVPISAMHAFVYRCGSRLSFEEFCKMDQDFIENIGKDSYGRQWHRFGKKKQLQMAFQAVSEEDQRSDGVEASNFESFLKVLAYCIGDKDNQTLLIERQVEVAVKRMKQPGPTCDLGAELLAAHTKLEALGKPVDHLPSAFWASYKRMKNDALKSFKSNFSPEVLAAPMSQLCNYQKALQTLQWPGEMEEAVKCAKELALQYAVLVADSDDLKKKSLIDQSLILGSMLLSSFEPAFNMHFGFLKLYLESKRDSLNAPRGSQGNGKCPSISCQGTISTNSDYGQGTEICDSCSKLWVAGNPTSCPCCLNYGDGIRSLSCKRNGNEETFTCNNCCGQIFTKKPGYKLGEMKMKVEKGKLVPVDKDGYKKAVSVDVPTTLEDSSHFGHVFWRCCQLLKEAQTES